MSEKPKKRKPYRKGLKADYGDATPEEVALAVLRYRPGARKPRVNEKQREQAEDTKR